MDYGNGSILSNATVNNDAWRHIAVTLPQDGTVSQTKIYIDGADATGTATNGANAVSTGTLIDLTLGKDGSTYYLGLLDDVRMYEGELDSSEVSSVYNQAVGDFNRIRIVGAGPVIITAIQPGNVTYAPANQVAQTITVGKLNQTISFSPLPNKSVGDFDFDPGATATSSLLISYHSSNTAVAEIVGVDADGDGNPDPGTQKIRPRAAGSAIITASQAGNVNYNAATSVEQTITVNYYNLFEHSIAGMQWWFDANNVDADNNPDVKTDQSSFFNWNDKSSNNRNAVQATAGNMPVYNANGLDGKATILFDADDSLNLPSTTGSKMIFVV
ncbi:MAG: hypothetical protein EB168_09015, partial [Euryarchaeota archaeon]|nr:hypothetical protein [Euryarchaeota archaeon]